MHVPKAPGWDKVFIFGAVWHVLITGCVWAAAVCLGGAVLIHAFGPAVRRRSSRMADRIAGGRK